MSSPAARAEARRRAILSRGGDRLAKLTTSARGEDAPAHPQGPLDTAADAPGARGSAAFVGETSSMPPPPPKDTPRPSPPPSDPSVWSPEHQHHVMQALMGGAPSPAPFARPPPFPSQPTPDDPLATIMAQLTRMNPQGDAAAAAGKTPVPPASPKPPTRLQKWLPLLHLVCMWVLLAVFVLWKEPQAFVEKTAGAVNVAFWKRWPKLATQGTQDGAWGVQVVPFFWAFMTLQVMLHSLRIFSGHDDIQPPALLSVVLPHLPVPLPSLIMNGLRYARMGSTFLDDMAAIVFGIGVILLVTCWLVD